jgi:hypothetical protein
VSGLIDRQRLALVERRSAKSHRPSILNLLRNASDAMVDVDDRPRQLLIKTEREVGDRVRLTIRDAGVGLSRENVDPPRCLPRAHETDEPVGGRMGDEIMGKRGERIGIESFFAESKTEVQAEFGKIGGFVRAGAGVFGPLRRSDGVERAA